MVYEPQKLIIEDRPVDGIGDFNTVRGGINPDKISVFVPGIVGVIYIYIYIWTCELITWYDSGYGPYRLQMTVTLCIISSKYATSNKTRGPHQGFDFSCIFF